MIWACVLHTVCSHIRTNPSQLGRCCTVVSARSMKSYEITWRVCFKGDPLFIHPGVRPFFTLPFPAPPFSLQAAHTPYFSYSLPPSRDCGAITASTNRTRSASALVAILNQSRGRTLSLSKHTSLFLQLIPKERGGYSAGTRRKLGAISHFFLIYSALVMMPIHVSAYLLVTS